MEERPTVRLDLVAVVAASATTGVARLAEAAGHEPPGSFAGVVSLLDSWLASPSVDAGEFARLSVEDYLTRGRFWPLPVVILGAILGERPEPFGVRFADASDRSEPMKARDAATFYREGVPLSRDDLARRGLDAGPLDRRDDGDDGFCRAGRIPSWASAALVRVHEQARRSAFFARAAIDALAEAAPLLRLDAKTASALYSPALAAALHLHWQRAGCSGEGLRFLIRPGSISVLEPRRRTPPGGFVAGVGGLATRLTSAGEWHAGRGRDRSITLSEARLILAQDSAQLTDGQVEQLCLSAARFAGLGIRQAGRSGVPTDIGAELAADE